MLQKWLKVIIILIIIILFTIPVLAHAPYDNYTYNFWKEPVPSPQAYVLDKVIGGKDYNIGQFNNPRDLFIKNKRIYLVDTNNNRIVIFDNNWNILKNIDSFKNQEKKDEFNEPEGVFVNRENRIYIADTLNSRIVVLNQDAKLIRIIEEPDPDEDEAEVIPDNFNFRPIRIGVDPNGRIYAISHGCNEGIIQFDESGEFKGFFGAPRIVPEVWEVFWKQIATEKQKQGMQLFVPTEYSSLDISKKGFIYTTVESGALVESAQPELIRKLNPTGDNILRDNGFTRPIGDTNLMGGDPSRFVDISGRDYGLYSALDRVRGRVFTYDVNGNLLYVFGSLGSQRGLFENPVALDNLGDKIVVLDAKTNEINVFGPTSYAELIHQALFKYKEGYFEQSTSNWYKILDINPNYSMAYSGIGKSLLRNNNFDEAMYYFRKGNDRKFYSKAFSSFRQQVIENNFGLIVTIILVLIIFSIIFIKLRNNYYRGKKSASAFFRLMVSDGEIEQTLKKKLIETYQGLRYSLYLIFHPFDGFWDLKHDKKGNLTGAVIILALVNLTYIFIRQYTGFIFNKRNLSELNIFLEMFSVIIPFFLWCVINYAFTTLMEGKGTFRDIFIASSYSLTPVILINIPTTIISNYLILEEGSFYYFFISFATIWMLTLLFCSTLVTHEYTLGKTVKTIILIIVGIMVALFLGLLFFALIDQIVNFFNDIYSEIVYRL